MVRRGSTPGSGEDYALPRTNSRRLQSRSSVAQGHKCGMILDGANQNACGRWCGRSSNVSEPALTFSPCLLRDLNFLHPTPSPTGPVLAKSVQTYYRQYQV